MARYRITLDRVNCIGCGACAAICPNRWKMEDDGKSQIIGGEEAEEGRFVKDIEEAEFPDNHEAANSCPVNVIHLKNLDTDEELI